MLDSLSAITYTRGLFPSNNYTNWELRKGSSESVDSFLNWIESGVYDALEKGYMKSLELLIYKNDVLVECYTYTVESGELNQVKCNTREQVLRNIFILTHSLQPLPLEECSMNIKLYYHDNITPIDYQPPHFVEDVHSGTTVLQGQIWKLGTVNTGQHSLTLKMQTAFSGFEQRDTQHNNNVEELPDERLVIEEPQHQAIVTIDCLCGSQSRDEVMSKCVECNTFQHYHCVGFEYQEDLASTACLKCQLKDKVYDEGLLVDICKYRRLLGYLWENGFTPVKQVQDDLHMTFGEVRRIKGLLQSDGFLRVVGKKYELVKNWNIQETKRKVFDQSVLFDKIGLENSLPPKKRKSNRMSRSKSSVTSTTLNL